MIVIAKRSMVYNIDKKCAIKTNHNVCTFFSEWNCKCLKWPLLNLFGTYLIFIHTLKLELSSTPGGIEKRFILH